MDPRTLDIERHASIEAARRAWMNPRIKLKDGVWTCCGRGVSGNGCSPKSAHQAWVVAISASQFERYH